MILLDSYVLFLDDNECNSTKDNKANRKSNKEVEMVRTTTDAKKGIIYNRTTSYNVLK